MELYAKNNSVDKRVITTCNGKEFLESELISDDINKNVITAAAIDANIYLYNNVDFIVYESHRNTWFNVPGYQNIFAPSMLSLGNSLYMAGGLSYSAQYPMISKQTKAMEGRVNCTEGKLFKHFDVREYKWS